MILQVGVKLIIQNENDEVLVIKRKGYDDLDGSWDIPGGRIEPDEDLMTGLKREVLEETGIKFSGMPRIIAAQDIFPPGRDLHVVRLTYLLKENIGDLTLSDEHSDYKYFSINKLKALTLEPLLQSVVSDLN